MKRIYSLIAVCAFALVSLYAFAEDVEPVISTNVHVVSGATPEQCPASWSGDIGEDQQVGFSGAGEETSNTSPGVRSCTGCAIDNKSGDCVCAKCYDYYDE